jgi:hypothetical protein
MPVFLPASAEERRHGRRRGNLKGRATDRAQAHFLLRTTPSLFKWHQAEVPTPLPKINIVFSREF